jgi:hypothetical protein
LQYIRNIFFVTDCKIKKLVLYLPQLASRNTATKKQNTAAQSKKRSRKSRKQKTATKSKPEQKKVKQSNRISEKGGSQHRRNSTEQDS